MACEALETFRRQVWDDGTLQCELLSVRDEAAFVACVVELGHAQGHEFTEAHVREALNGARRAWIERGI